MCAALDSPSYFLPGVNHLSGSAYLAQLLGYADTEYVVENVTIFALP